MPWSQPKLRLSHKNIPRNPCLLIQKLHSFINCLFVCFVYFKKTITLVCLVNLHYLGQAFQSSRTVVEHGMFFEWPLSLWHRGCFRWQRPISAVLRSSRLPWTFSRSVGTSSARHDWEAVQKYPMDRRDKGKVAVWGLWTRSHLLSRHLQQD